VQPTFSDGHNTGIYTWEYLYKLGSQKDALWATYLDRLHASGFDGDSGREPGRLADRPIDAPAWWRLRQRRLQAGPACFRHSR
jgi:hypothetical protein